MLQNARVTVFTVGELLRENQQGMVKLQEASGILGNMLKTKIPVLGDTYS